MVWEYNWKYDDKGKEIRSSASKFHVTVQQAIDENDSDIDSKEEKK